MRERERAQHNQELEAAKKTEIEPKKAARSGLAVEPESSLKITYFPAWSAVSQAIDTFFAGQPVQTEVIRLAGRIRLSLSLTPPLLRAPALWH